MEGQQANMKLAEKSSKGSKSSPSVGKEEDNLLNPPYITIQEEVDYLLDQFDIVGIEAIPTAPSYSITDPPE